MHHFPTGIKISYINSLILVSRILFNMYKLSFYSTSQKHNYWKCLNNYIIHSMKLQIKDIKVSIW